MISENQRTQGNKGRRDIALMYDVFSMRFLTNFGIGFEHLVLTLAEFLYLHLVGDYSPTPRSVIGALQRDLGISVRNLAKDKEEDLRRLFSCWWSKPLQSSYNFERLMCFEGSFKRGTRPPMVVSEVFRCLVSMCKDKDIKVIMPLLAAGDQVCLYFVR